MLSNYSSNVVLAKARAMYGRRLSKQNYTDMLACHSVNEIASYLKTRTAYSNILSGVNDAEIHRGRLEILLRQKIFEDSAALCRYEISVGEHFSQYLQQRAETEQIMHSVMHLMAGSPEEYLFAMPAYLNRHTRIDLPALGRIKNYEDLLNALSHTHYYKILQRFRPIEGQPIDYYGIENALYQNLYALCYRIIKEHTRGETRRQLTQLFHVYMDLENYDSIMRLKFNYHAGPDFIKSSLFPYGTLKERHITALLEAQTPEEARKALASTSIGKRILKADASEELLSMQIEYGECRKNIRFSTHPSVVMLSYIFLMQIELHDITNIIEGVRYQIPSDDIANLLTIIHFP